MALPAVAMGAQNAVVRRPAVPDPTTTVLTLTTAGLFADRTSNQVRLRRVASILSMMTGSLVGGLLLRHGRSRLRCGPPRPFMRCVRWRPTGCDGATGPRVEADRAPTITSTAVATERPGRTFTDRLAALPASFPGTYLTDDPSTPIPEGCSAFPGGAGRSPNGRGRCPVRHPSHPHRRRHRADPPTSEGNPTCRTSPSARRTPPTSSCTTRTTGAGSPSC
ncbi:DUF1275 family protein [Streptomyces canus]|uniref:DUF1275 family protein n=1 Tax=Streptomyces canus TaxID=58343 RepID=UPI0036E1011D